MAELLELTASSNTLPKKVSKISVSAQPLRGYSPTSRIPPANHIFLQFT